MLEVRNLGVRYGRHIALQGVSATVGKGEICVILGANGAGKSSLLKAIAGMVTAEPGSEVVMNGRPIVGMKPHRIVEEGIALVPEGRGIFGELTVAENLQLGAFANRARKHEAETLKLIYELFPRLGERRNQVARTMSGGEQQMVAIGRALMSKPDILMLDEPSLGLSPILSKELFRALARIASTGVGILLVEQNARLSLKISDRGYLIENGLITGENSAEALMNDPAVVNAYLGGSETARGERRTARRGMRLPPPFALPSGLDAIGRLVSALAARAGAIHAAFIKALRRGAPVPSAFEGRFDPEAGPDPWDELAALPVVGVEPRAVHSSQAAREIAASAAELAEKARERLAAHIAARRSRPDAPGASSAQLPTPAVPARPVPSAPAISAAEIASMAEAAGERLREHVRARRHEAPLPQPAAPQKMAAPQVPPATDALDPENLARAAGERLRAHVDAQRREVPPAPPPASQTPRVAQPEQPSSAQEAAPPPPSGGGFDPENLARAAGERLRGHIAAGRAGVTLMRPIPRPVRKPEPEPGKEAPPEPLAAGGSQPPSGPWLGHNSAGANIELDELEPATADLPTAAQAPADLAARAAAIQAAHLAARRRTLTIYNISPDSGPSSGKEGKKQGAENQ